MDQEARYWRDKWLETQKQLHALRKSLVNDFLDKISVKRKLASKKARKKK